MASADQEVAGVVRAQILFEYFEALFEEKTTDDLEQIDTSCSQWLAEKKDLSKLEEVIIAFYQILAANPPPEEKVQQFRGHESTLRSLPASPQRDLILAAILDQLSRLPGPDETGFFALLDESLALKQAHQDRHGISINYGSRGDYYQWFRNRWHGGELDPTAARKWYDKQEGLAREMGDRAVLAMVTNKLAGLDINAAKQCTEANEALGFWRMGLERARWCLRVAVELEREGDIVFAASATLQAASGFGDMDAVVHAAQSIARKDVWEVLRMKPDGFLKTVQGVKEALVNRPEDQQPNNWKEAIQAVQVAEASLQEIVSRRSQT